MNCLQKFDFIAKRMFPLRIFFMQPGGVSCSTPGSVARVSGNFRKRTEMYL